MVESFPHAMAFFAWSDPIGFIQAVCMVSLGPVSLGAAIWIRWANKGGHSRA